MLQNGNGEENRSSNTQVDALPFSYRQIHWIDLFYIALIIIEDFFCNKRGGRTCSVMIFCCDISNFCVNAESYQLIYFETKFDG
jgi:hypothetical protein